MRSAIHVELKLAGAAAPLLSAHANVLVGPPDFAPDRRPFLSIADDLNDRSADADARNAQLQGADLDRWVEDLFERAYETVSLMNVDFWRSTRGIRRLAPGKLGSAIAGDAVAPRDQAMGSRDKLRAANIQIEAPSNDHPLPLAERARDRHRSISDVNTLKDLVFAHPKSARRIGTRSLRERSRRRRRSNDDANAPFHATFECQSLDHRRLAI